MTTSGVTGYNLTTAEIILEAFDICGIAVEGEDLTPEEYARGLRSLNLMLRDWQAQGIHLWTYQEGTVFMQQGRSSYPLNNITIDPVFNKDEIYAVNSDELVITELTIDGVMGSDVYAVEQNSVVNDQGVEYILGTDFDSVGFLKSDGTIFWSFANQSQTQLGEPFPEDMPAGTLAFWVENEHIMDPVERVLDVRRLNATVGNNQNEVPVQFESQKDFASLPNKKSQGTVNEATFQRALPSGVLHVWQVPLREDQLIRITYERKMQNFVNTDDDPDIPDYFIKAVVNNLAVPLAGKFNVSQERKAEIRADAYESLQQALSFDDANYDFKVSLNRNVRS